MIREDAGLHRAQRAFRSVLDAFARPGTVHVVEPAANSPARPVALGASLEAVVRLFVDQAVTFCVADAESDATAAYLTGETHARRFPVREADFVGVPARADAQTAEEAVAQACRGTLVSPEKGATVLVGCARLAPADEAAGECGDEPALHVVEVRGLGLMVAADLAEDVDANDVVLRALGKGLVINATGPHTLRFLPPLVCEEQHVDQLVERLSCLLGV